MGEWSDFNIPINPPFLANETRLFQGLQTELSLTKLLCKEVGSLKICLIPKKMFSKNVLNWDFLFFSVPYKVSLLGVDSLWGDCTFILADWGS